MFGMDPLVVMAGDRYDTLIRLACYDIAVADENRKYKSKG